MWGIRNRRSTLLAGGLVVVIAAVALGVVVVARAPVEGTTSATDPSPGELAKAPPQAAVATTPAASGASVASGPAGLRAFIDPRTGRLTDTPSRERREIGRRALDRNRNARGLVQERLSNGAIAVDLQGRFHTSLVATVNADGSVTTRCLQHPDASEPHDHGPEPESEAAVEDPS